MNHTNNDIINGLLKLRKELCSGPCGQSSSTLQMRADREELLTRAIARMGLLESKVSLLQRIESAAKSLTDAWQRGDHEQAIVDAVAKLTKEVQQ